MIIRSVYLLFSVLIYSVLASDKIKLYCDFEDDLCLWRHETQYTEGRKWIHSTKDSFVCGKFCPFQDNRFLYITSRHLTGNGTFVRIAHYPLVAQYSASCTLTLRYIAYGVNFAKLVIAIRLVGQKDPEPILVVPSSQTKEWHQVKVPLIANYIFTPVIQAIREQSDLIDFDLLPSEGFIAIDDTKLSIGCIASNGDDDNGNDKENSINDDIPSNDDNSSNEDNSNSDANSLSTNHDNLKSTQDEEIFVQQFRPISSIQDAINRDNNGQISLDPELIKLLASKSNTNRSYDLVRTYQRLRVDSETSENDQSLDKIPYNYEQIKQQQNLCDESITDCSICLLYSLNKNVRCPVACNFDEIEDQDQFKKLCGWTQTRTDSKFSTWILVSPSHASRYVSVYPKKDGNTKNGKYLILNLKKSLQLPPTHFNSPIYISTKSTCYFTFSYFIYDRTGHYYLTLTINDHQNSQLINNEESSLVLWKSSRSSNWRNASAYIGEQREPFYLSFIRSSSPHSRFGTIALDNFKFIAC